MGTFTAAGLSKTPRAPGGARSQVAFRIPETGPELEKYRKLGLEEVASAK